MSIRVSSRYKRNLSVVDPANLKWADIPPKKIGKKKEANAHWADLATERIFYWEKEGEAVFLMESLFYPEDTVIRLVNGREEETVFGNMFADVFLKCAFLDWDEWLPIKEYALSNKRCPENYSYGFDLVNRLFHYKVREHMIWRRDVESPITRNVTRIDDLAAIQAVANMHAKTEASEL
jgi:hypothetical protein